jgi:methylenetetrahydrofolate reductase (NADPH)
MSLKTSLETGKFTATVEINPLKWQDKAEIDKLVTRFGKRVAAVNVADRPSSVARLSPLGTCYLLQRAGIESVCHITCRDRNQFALQAELLNAYILGIPNILVLTGDVTVLSNGLKVKSVFEMDAVQLMKLVQRLGDGFDIAGKQYSGKIEFYVGAAANPRTVPPIALRSQLRRMEKKVTAGARFFQTQPVFSLASFSRFMKEAGRFSVPVLAGILPLKSLEVARYLNENVPGIVIPDKLLARLEASTNLEATGLEIATELVKGLKDLCQGIHIMPIGWNRSVPAILDAAGL